MESEIERLKEMIGKLEFQNDQLLSEIQYVDSLLRRIGFTEGLSSVKSAAKEIEENNKIHGQLYEDGLPDSPPGFDD